MKILPHHLSLGDQIGGGGFAIVFAGTLDRKEKKINVAIKRISNQIGAAEAVKKEVDILGRVKHRNVVECYGAVFDDKAVDCNQAHLGYCIVLELCTTSLRDALEFSPCESVGSGGGGGGGGDDDKTLIRQMLANSDVREKVLNILIVVIFIIQHP